MTRKEALEFLELPDNSPDDRIYNRITEKLNYFSQLSENAPNDFLKKLHLKNIEKVNLIKNSISQGGNVPAPSQAGTRENISPGQSPYQDNNYQEPVVNSRPAMPTTPDFSRSQRETKKTAVALLVRHTENQRTKTFELYEGDNVIGRLPVAAGKNVIEIDNDEYVSRHHAVITIDRGQIYLSDDAQANGGRASKNGTYVNSRSERITTRVRLKEEDTVQIGMTKFIIRLNNTNIDKIVHEVEESNYMKTVVIDIF
jgi:ketosteroid isomerase-like protein